MHPIQITLKFNKLHFIIIFTTLLIGFLQGSTAYVSNQKDLEQPKIEVDNSGVFKIVNYNILEGGKYPGWKEIIKAENADILLLTETGLWSSKDGTIDNGVAEVNALFPGETPYSGVTFHPDSVTDGQAILSRYPIVDTILLPVLDLDDGSTWNVNHEVIDAVININGLNIHFIVIHGTCCDSGLASRLKESEGINNYIDTLGDDVPIIYAGDFNSGTSEDEYDPYYDGSSLGSEPVEMLINESHPKSPISHKFTDMYRTLNPYLQGHTYVDSTYQSRIDYIFVNEPLVGAMVNSTVLDFYPESYTGSDHIPMNAYFNLNYDTVDLRPPIPIGQLNATVSESNTILTWENGTDSDIDKFNIYRDGTIISTVDVNSTSFVDDQNYFANTIYKYEVTIKDINDNESPKSLPLSVNSSYGILSKPSDIVLSITEEIPGALHLTWVVGDDGGLQVTEYTILRSLDPNGAFVYHDKITEPELVDERVRAGTVIYYKIKAKNALGYSLKSNIASGSALPKTTETTSEDESSYPLMLMIPAMVVLLRRKKKLF